MRRKRGLAALGLVCAAALALTLGVGGKSEAANLRATFFDAGSADAILIQTQDSAVLVDAGLKADGDALVERLRSAGVSRLDALIVTHFDKDHIGGAPAVLSALPVETVWQPDYVKDASAYERYARALSETGVAVRTLRQEDAAFTLDGVSYVLSAARQSAYEEDESNNFSLCVTVTWGETVFLLPGDAETDRLRELLAADVGPCDVLKVPHHGEHDRESAAFFQAMSPQIAVITSSDEEPEDAKVTGLLTGLGAQVFLTRQGTVVCESDGERVLVTQGGAILP